MGEAVGGRRLDRLRSTAQSPMLGRAKDRATTEKDPEQQQQPRRTKDRKLLRTDKGVVIVSNDGPQSQQDDRRKAERPTTQAAGHPSGLICYCNDFSCNLPKNRCYTTHKCIVSLVTWPDSQNYSYGCLDDDDTLLRISSCRGLAVGRGPEKRPYGSECCDSGDLCNLNLPVTLKYPPAPPVGAPNGGSTIAASHELPGGSSSLSMPSQGHLIVTVGVPIIGVIIITIAVVAAVILRWRPKLTKRRRYEHRKTNLDTDLFASPADSLELQDQISSGSGSGTPMLVQSTVARNVNLIKPIGKGRYGEVWLGRYQGSEVAVKVFSSREEASWVRENEIYSTLLLPHINVLNFVAADTTSRASCTQHWLITDYHPRGSLHDCLSHGAGVGAATAVRMLLSAAAGLAHLHTDIRGAKGKPAIAHRDVKSKNILVKLDSTCCIADLGLAVARSRRDENAVELGGANARVGTKRYMAPEVLDGALDSVVSLPADDGGPFPGPNGSSANTLLSALQTPDIDAFKRADVYAFGLVIWEVARRCIKNGVAEDYKVPYYDCVGNDPSFEEMRNVVVTQNIRPQIPARWLSDEILLRMTKMMKECWAAKPQTRLTMLRVKKTLQELDDFVEFEQGGKEECPA